MSYEHLRRQVDETMGEKEQYIQSANDAAKVRRPPIIHISYEASLFFVLRNPMKSSNV